MHLMKKTPKGTLVGSYAKNGMQVGILNSSSFVSVEFDEKKGRNVVTLYEDELKKCDVEVIHLSEEECRKLSQ